MTGSIMFMRFDYAEFHARLKEQLKERNHQPRANIPETFGDFRRIEMRIAMATMEKNHDRIPLEGMSEETKWKCLYGPFNSNFATSVDSLSFVQTPAWPGPGADKMQVDITAVDEYANIPQGCWRTKDGRMLEITDMDDVHLINTIAMLQRNAEKKRVGALMVMLKCPGPTSEHAADAFASELAELSEATWRDHIYDAYGSLLIEIHKRGLELKPEFKLDAVALLNR